MSPKATIDVKVLLSRLCQKNSHILKNYEQMPPWIFCCGIFYIFLSFLFGTQMTSSQRETCQHLYHLSLCWTIPLMSVSAGDSSRGRAEGQQSPQTSCRCDSRKLFSLAGEKGQPLRISFSTCLWEFNFFLS